MNLISALGLFVLIMGFAVGLALAIGWFMTIGGGFIRAIFGLPPALAIDPVVGHAAGLQHSHERSQALRTHSDCASGSGSEGGGDCGGAD